MRKLIPILLFLVALPLGAFHIVGGEIEFITISPGCYRINIVQYFDKAQTNNPGPEAQAEVYIFSNKDNRFVSRHLLVLESEEIVRYTNEECSIDELQTSRVVWTVEVELEPENYADPEGYYIVWERCCRNNGVVNIVNPDGTGMKYVSEIPPLWKNGIPFINSSPQIFRPLSDYACVGQLYYVEFTGVDPDGDSLVYRLANPLNSSAAVALPVPQPKPHPEVFFAQPYSVENMIPGDPALQISNRGLLTVNPQDKGLYVFSVLVDEYRDGVQIGQVQRDFQMLVIDDCLPPDPPEVGIIIPGNDNFQSELDTLTYALADDKCFEFIVKNITPGETISLRAVGVNFNDDINDIFSFRQSLIGANQDSLVVEVCAPGCPPVRDRPFIVDLIAGDDACPLPQLDTLRLMILVEPPPNQFPSIAQGNQTVTINEDDLYVFDFTVTDSDGDSIDLDFFVAGLENPEQFGFSFIVTSNEPGLATGQLIWDTNCLVYDFSEIQRFQVGIRADDRDECDVPNPDITFLNLTVLLPPNTPPVVSIPQLNSTLLTVAPNTQITFDVVLEDTDDDEVELTMTGVGFNPAAFQVQFANATGFGTVTSPFSWFADCNFAVPGESNSFTFLFIGDDFDKCKTKNFDTLAVTIVIDLPPNSPPEFEPSDDFIADVNVPFSFSLVANDPDMQDRIIIAISPRTILPGSSPPQLISNPGFGRATALFEWTPGCDLLQGESSADFAFTFFVTDGRCPVSLEDEITVNVSVVETRERFGLFNAPNVFTPNGDGKNDVFTMSGHENPTYNLPIDVCDDEFQYISIHDRTGKTVFYSESRSFSWDGGNQPIGLYFFLVKYSKTEFKNYLKLFR